MDRRCTGSDQNIKFVTQLGKEFKIQCFSRYENIKNNKFLELTTFTWEWMNFCATKKVINIKSYSNEQVFTMQIIFKGMEIEVVFIVIQFDPILKSQFDVMAIELK